MGNGKTCFDLANVCISRGGHIFNDIIIASTVAVIVANEFANNVPIALFLHILKKEQKNEENSKKFSKTY